MQFIVRALYRLRLLKVPGIVEGIWALLLFVFKTHDSAYVCPRDAKGLDLGVRVDFIGADIRFEHI
jgi:hypothetical protein